MNLDLRIPMGLLFTLVGGIMTVFGFFTRGSEIYQRSSGMNINLTWGLVMLIFGAIMYTLGRRADKRPNPRRSKELPGPSGMATDTDPAQCLHEATHPDCPCLRGFAVRLRAGFVRV